MKKALKMVINYMIAASRTHYLQADINTAIKKEDYEHAAELRRKRIELEKEFPSIKMMEEVLKELD